MLKEMDKEFQVMFDAYKRFRIVMQMHVRNKSRLREIIALRVKISHLLNMVDNKMYHYIFMYAPHNSTKSKSVSMRKG
jgi:hypothetical protein